MTATLTIQPIGAFSARITPPGSKSLTNRALLLAALAEGSSTLRGVLDADDPRRMRQALRQLGFTLEAADGGSTVRLTGGAGRLGPAEGELHLGNAGTAYRFLTAALCLGEGSYTLTGIPRMHQRPIGELVDALRALGGRIDYLGGRGFPPLRVHGGGLEGGALTMAPTLSSQYLSALLQVGPFCRQGLGLRFRGPITSRPYVAMTVGLMRRFGARVEVAEDYSHIAVAPGGYAGLDYTIEPDASSASYFLAAAAVAPGSRCTIEGLGQNSLQGDVGFADLLHQMGCGLLYGADFITVIGPRPGERLHGIDVDLNDMPDMAQTLAAVALFAQGPTVIRNVGNLRVKETDRLAALHNELTKLGATVEIEGDDLTIYPPPDHQISSAAIDTYKDHRMAMSFAVVGLGAPGITINDPGCVDKTYPDFFADLSRLGASPHA